VKTLRFDDICINTDMKNAIEIAEYVKELGWNVIFCVSPLVNKSSDQRVYPKRYNAYSDYRIFYKMTDIGIPKFPSWIKIASHGLVHVDHRLLSKEAQELSIITSCYLTAASLNISQSKMMFVPPFNKWNRDTMEICKEHNIELIKFEDGWTCAEHEKYDPYTDLWYIHSREWTLETFKKWMGNEDSYTST